MNYAHFMQNGRLKRTVNNHANDYSLDFVLTHFH